ncbi:MAG: hypothetical protein OZ948_15115 [Deltaproteobacteria bacterium]|nr:hypothetical protein [Deltaproteobacteria bacterium]
MQGSVSPWPIRVGVIGSGIWLLFFLAYASWQHAAIPTMEPNETGDFLAGWFAPLAFLWLVVGYLQQSSELRLQVEELRLQVAATQQMAASALARDKRDDLLAQPIFVMGQARRKGDGPIFEFQLTNQGAEVTHVTLGGVTGSLKLADASRQVLQKGSSLQIAVQEAGMGWFEISYTDLQQKRRSAWFLYDRSRIYARELGEGPMSPEDTGEWLRSKAKEVQ